MMPYWTTDILAVVVRDILDNGIEWNTIERDFNTVDKTKKEIYEELSLIATNVSSSDDPNQYFMTNCYNRGILTECKKNKSYANIAKAIWILELLTPSKPSTLATVGINSVLNSNYATTHVKVFYKAVSIIDTSAKRHNRIINKFLKNVVVITDPMVEKYWLTGFEGCQKIKILIDSLGNFCLDIGRDFKKFVLNGKRSFQKEPFSQETEDKIYRNIIDRIIYSMEQQVSIYIAPEMLVTEGVINKIISRFANIGNTSLRICIFPFIYNNNGVVKNVVYIWRCNSYNAYYQGKMTPYTFSDNGAWYEEYISEPEKVFRIFDIDGFASIGVMVCVDFLQDELYQIYRKAGVDIIIVPSLSINSEPFFDVMRSRALDGVGTIYANQCSFCQDYHTKAALILPNDKGGIKIYNCKKSIRDCENCKDCMQIMEIIRK